MIELSKRRKETKHKMDDWKELFLDLLEEIEQCPHPMAEDIWNKYNDIHAQMIESEESE
jgi:hypothetical protein